MLEALTLATTLLLTAAPDAADTRELVAKTRTPVEPAVLHLTDFQLDRYHREYVVVRKRTEGKSFVAFQADPQLLDRGAMMVFEVQSVAPHGVVPRWRCIAQHDIAECLGASVKIAYLPEDTEIRLVAKVKPKTDVTRPVNAVASR